MEKSSSIPFHYMPCLWDSVVDTAHSLEVFLSIIAGLQVQKSHSSKQSGIFRSLGKLMQNIRFVNHYFVNTVMNLRNVNSLNSAPINGS